MGEKLVSILLAAPVRRWDCPVVLVVFFLRWPIRLAVPEGVLRDRETANRRPSVFVFPSIRGVSSPACVCLFVCVSSH